MKPKFPTGVILSAYPDSIGGKLSHVVNFLKKTELKDVFSLFYILPTFFNSDLDRGFSIIDYNINNELVSGEDLTALAELNIKLKFDLVLNHLSVRSPQFQDMLRYGDQSEYKDFFIDWNAFWREDGEMGPEGFVIPREDHLQKLFMRKSDLPILKVRFPDGSDRFYWNTFYQKVCYLEFSDSDFTSLDGITNHQATEVAAIVNQAINNKVEINQIDWGDYIAYRKDIIAIVECKRVYLGQMDLNATSEKVWEFYDATLQKVHALGAKIIRLDAFAYLHKQPGMANFFNKPGTWGYLDRLNKMAEKYDLILLPEIHCQYGAGIHVELAEKGHLIYDFFFPGLVLDALDRGINKPLLRWIGELVKKGIKTVNMLGCHDGIPVIDLKSNQSNHPAGKGLLTDQQIDATMARVLERGGRIKYLYNPDGKKISYYQVNATFFSALGQDEQKLRLARAIQLFMPGIPQVWYLDLFAGKNNYEAADNIGAGGHKEINRTNLTLIDIENGLKQAVVKDQLQMIRLRNTSSAFSGELEIGQTKENQLQLTWKNGETLAALYADLRNCGFRIMHRDESGRKSEMHFPAVVKNFPAFRLSA
jgi:sucrose phosphorylase